MGIPSPPCLILGIVPTTNIQRTDFGQRQPKVSLIDKESDKPWLERCYIPCPHCETLNDARLWANGHAFGNWFGLICPSCHQIIPCLWNIFSLAILAITFPLWYFPVRFFRRRWLEKEKERLANALERPLIQAKSINWLFRGIVYWGGSMWVILGVIPQVWSVLNGKEWDLIMMFVMLPILVGNRLCVGLSHAFLDESKGEKGRQT